MLIWVTNSQVFLGSTLAIDWEWSPEVLLPLRLPGVMASVFAHRSLSMLDALRVEIESEKKSAIAKTEKRLIKAGGVRKKNLTKEEEIILTLFYLHQIPTFQTLGINFGISESSANNIFHYWIDIFRKLLPASLLEQVKKKKMNWNG